MLNLKEQPTIGAVVVSKVLRFKEATQIVAQHKGKYAGSGYTQGLKEDKITLETRIIAVVYAWDAMRTDRPYRNTLTRDEATQNSRITQRRNSTPK